MTERARFGPLDVSLALALFSIALALRVSFVAAAPFDGLYGQDAYAYHDFALALRTAVSTGSAPGPFFWPLGYPALLAAGYALFGASAQTAQAISLLLGALLAPLVYVLARQVGPGRAGAVAGALVMAVCGQAIQSSLVVMSDIPALALATASAVVVRGYLQRGGAARLAAAVLLLALAGITRWIYLALALPWALAVLAERRRWPAWREIAAGALAAAVVLVPQMAYSATNPFPALNHPWVTGWTPANAAARVFDNPDGHFVYDQVNALFYAHPYYDAYFLSPLLTPLLILGAWALRKRRAAWLMLLGWTLIPYVFLAGIPYQNIRFPLIVMPAVAVLAGAGADALLGLARGRRFGRVVPAALAVWIAAGLIQAVFTGRPMVTQFIANQQADKNAAAWVTDQIPHGATLYTYGLALTLKHYTDFDVHELYFETPDSLARERLAIHADYLFANIWVIEHQWAGRSPEIAYDWLRDQRGLTPLGHFGNYQLFRIAA